MNSLVLNLFIIVANIIAILLTYYSLGKKIENKKRILYTMVSIGMIAIWVFIIYSIASIGIKKEVAKGAKDMITYAFVPVNVILVIPFAIRIFFNKTKMKQKAKKWLIILLGAVLIISAGEIIYIKNVEKGIEQALIEQQNENNKE